MTKHLWTHNFIRTETPTKLFSCEFCELLAAFLQKTYGRLLSDVKNPPQKNQKGNLFEGTKIIQKNVPIHSVLAVLEKI